LHDLVFWDNRRVMHHATPYPETQRRHMHRTTVKGSAPYLDRQYLARALSSTP
jgi:taurine dioxygenase